NYWTWKDSEIQAALEEYKIELPDGYDRKLAIEAIKEADKAAVGDGFVEDEDGKKTYVEKLKEEEPTLELVKVIFHSTGEQDLPYVYVGHNGRGFYIPKEIEVDVPKYILESCIKDAVEDRIMPQTNPRDGSINWIVRKVQRFPYSIVNL
ncbi:MAG: hypothetical protein GWN00_13350, partial [Aliifodinibius sp.]|nr:hypothetical protein [Fodinibius sp.]NIV12122.1 hypothetical protein [Fodinibius sp.]NIY25755.1 hypothetical protein [Fodinibius sp.]